MYINLSPFQVKETAFIFNEEANEFKSSENSTSSFKSEKRKVRKGALDTLLHSPPKRKKHEEICSDETFESESNSDLSTEDCPVTPDLSVEKYIRKSGGALSPVYSCRVGGCKFSVKKSLLCMKGHILAEHWPSLVCSQKQA